MESGYILPSGWIRTTIEEISEVNKRNQALRGYPDDMLVTFVPMAAVDAREGVIASPQIRHLGEVRKGFTPFSNGDVIIAKITPSMENGKAAIAKGLQNGIGFGSTEFHVMSPKPIVLPSYLFYFIRQESFRWDAKAHFAGTAGQLRVPSSFIEKYPIPLPPLPEQERIVARIESLFTQLEAGVAALKRARAALKRYKASVLKAACEGRLVAQEEGDESAEVMLRRMGKEPLGGEGLAELPEGWCWAKWEQVGVSQNGRGFPSKEYQSKGVKLLRPGNLFANGKVIWTEDNTRYMPEIWAKEFPAFIVGPSELIMNLTAQSLKDEFLGRICMTGVDEYCLLNQRLARLKPEVGETRYFLWLFKSQLFRKFVDRLNKGSLIQHMFTSQLAEFVLPLPPIPEQHRIVAEIERRLSVVQELEGMIEANLRRAGRLRQAVLKRAFEGRLG